MQLHEFYERTLPASGHYTLFRTSTRKHLWTDSIEHLVELTDANDHHPDVYFATATFAEPGSRTQANVDQLKSFRLDLDAGAAKLAKHGPENIYATQQDAIADFVRFSKDAQLSPSLIVSSGEGLHVYYELDSAVSPEVWTPAAKQFQKFCVGCGLKVDASVTADSARILRPIGTLHPNGKTVSLLKDTGKVYSMEEFSHLIDHGGVVVPKQQYDLSINDDISPVKGPPKSLKKLLTHCAAARYASANQDSIDEPYWRAMIGLAKHSTEGREGAHMLSFQHPGYDESLTDEKYDRWATGPTTCAVLESFNAKACAGCKHKGKIKSPLQLGALTEVEVESLPAEQKPTPPAEARPTGAQWDGKLPPKFEVVAEKGLPTLVYSMHTEKLSETGELIPMVIRVPFTTDIFWFDQWAEADHSTDAAQVTMRLWTGTGTKTYTMDQSLVASPAKLLEYLSGKAIHTTTHKKATQAMQDYAKAGLQAIKEVGKRPKVSDHLGLRILDDGELVCAHGRHVIYPDGSIQEAMLSPHLREVASQFPLPLSASFNGSWGPEVWDEVINPKALQHVEFLQKYYGSTGMERFQLAVMLGLASPLMPFVTGEYHMGSALPRNSSLSVSLFSRESARGKTTAVMSSILAYGKPAELANDAGKAGTTDNARISRLSIHGTMPSIMDEMGGATASSVASIISAVANGAARARSTKEGGLNSSAPWALINLITTNTSQRDMISVIQDTSGAIQYRLLEINVEDMPEYSQELRDRFTEDWSSLNRHCTGALGAVIHKAICAQGVVQVSKLVTDCVARAGALMKSDQTARFQYRALGAMMALHVLLKQQGIEIFPLKPLVETFRVAHDAGREYVVETVLPTDGVQLLARALLDLVPHTLVTKDETRINRHSTQWDHPLNLRMPDVVQARHIQASGITYVSVQAVRDWCNKRGVSEKDIVRSAVKAGVLRTWERVVNGSLTKLTSSPYNLSKGIKDNTGLASKAYTVFTRKLDTGDADLDLSNVIELHPQADPADPAGASEPTGT